MTNLKPARAASHGQGACVSRLSRRAIQRRWRKPCALQSAHVSWLPGAPFAGSASSRQPSNISCWRFSDVSFSVNVRFAPKAVIHAQIKYLMVDGLQVPNRQCLLIGLLQWAILRKYRLAFL